MAPSTRNRKLTRSCKSMPGSADKSVNYRPTSSSMCTPKSSRDVKSSSSSSDRLRLTRSICKRQHRNGNCFTPSFSMEDRTTDRRKSTGSHNSTRPNGLRRWKNKENVSREDCSPKFHELQQLSNVQNGSLQEDYMTYASKQARQNSRTKTCKVYEDKYISVPKPFSLENSPSGQKLYIKCASTSVSKSKAVVVLQDLFKEDEQTVNHHRDFPVPSGLKNNQRAMSTCNSGTQHAKSLNMDSSSKTSRPCCRSRKQAAKECNSKAGQQYVQAPDTGRPQDDGSGAARESNPDGNTMPLDGLLQYITPNVSSRKMVTAAATKMFSPKPRPLNSVELSDNKCSIL